MKLKKDFLVHNTDEETLLVPAGSSDFYGVVRGNKTLGVILDLLREDTTEDQIVSAMAARFDAPEDRIRRDVEQAISELRKIGALDE